MRNFNFTNPSAFLRPLLASALFLLAFFQISMAQCPVPGGLASATLSATSVRLSWAANGTNSFVLHIENANNNPTLFNTEFGVTGTSFTAGLPAVGNYKFKVRSVCGGDKSNWSPDFFFSSGVPGGGGGGGGACAIPGGLAAASLGATSAKLSWTAVAGASGYTLQIENASGNNTFFNVEFPVSGNVFTAGVPVSGNYKFKVRSHCANGKSDYSAFLGFAVGNAGGGVNPPPPPPPPPSTGNYCASKGDAPWHDWIGNVKIGEIEKESEKSQYSNFTTSVFSAARGVPVNVRLTANYSWFTYDEYWKIWVDLNKNGSFEEPGELLFQQKLARPADGTSNARIFGSLTIPASAAAGATRMRVSMKRGGFATPCEAFANGEVEDYTLNIPSALAAGEIRAQSAPDPSALADFAIFPQPASDQVRLNLDAWVGREAMLTVLTPQGKTIRDIRLGRIENPLQMLDLADFANGHYFVTLRAEGMRPITKKLVVSRMY